MEFCKCNPHIMLCECILHVYASALYILPIASSVTSSLSSNIWYRNSTVPEIIYIYNYMLLLDSTKLDNYFSLFLKAILCILQRCQNQSVWFLWPLFKIILHYKASMETKHRRGDTGSQLWSFRLLCYRWTELTASEYEDSVQWNFLPNRRGRKKKVGGKKGAE
jgi:hypothetical protein